MEYPKRRWALPCRYSITRRCIGDADRTSSRNTEKLITDDWSGELTIFEYLNFTLDLAIAYVTSSGTEWVAYADDNYTK